MNTRIFSYSNGKETVFADPLAVERRWFKACESVDINSILDRFYGPDFLHNIDENGIAHDDNGKPLPEMTPESIELALKEREEAVVELLPVLYEAFQLSPIDPKTGEGTTETEALKAYSDFMEFRINVKKNTETYVNSSQSTESASQSNPTKNSADSTGTKTEQSQSEL